MKLRTLADEPVGRWNMDDVDHDRKAAHALMQAMNELSFTESYETESYSVLSIIQSRAASIMREWGFDSGEVV